MFTKNIRFRPLDRLHGQTEVMTIDPYTSRQNKALKLVWTCQKSDFSTNCLVWPRWTLNSINFEVVTRVIMSGECAAELFSEVRPNSSVRFGSAGDKMFGRHRTYFHQRKGKYQAIYRQIKTLGKKVFCRNSFARCSEYLENYSYLVLYRFVSLGLHFNTIRFQWKKFGVRFGSVRPNLKIVGSVEHYFETLDLHSISLSNRAQRSIALSALICAQRSLLCSVIAFALSTLICAQLSHFWVIHCSFCAQHSTLICINRSYLHSALPLALWLCACALNICTR